MKLLHILLAEDNRGDILLVREALEQHQIQHTLHIVENGQDALDYITRMGKANEEPCPDVILLDLNLPKADGPAVLSEFRKHPECIQTPVIVVTSSDSPRDRARVAELGISHYFRKPTDFAAYMELGAIVREVVQNQTA
jgi:CheY-like chemotaxis protein